MRFQLAETKASFGFNHLLYSVVCEESTKKAYNMDIFVFAIKHISGDISLHEMRIGKKYVNHEKRDLRSCVME